MIGHTQLLIGVALYFVFSPITRYFMENGAAGNEQMSFFGVWHAIVMVLAIVAMTIGGSVAKRATSDTGKFKSITIWFSIALVMILMAIPWFRPFFRSF